MYTIALGKRNPLMRRMRKLRWRRQHLRVTGSRPTKEEHRSRHLENESKRLGRAAGRHTRLMQTKPDTAPWKVSHLPPLRSLLQAPLDRALLYLKPIHKNPLRQTSLHQNTTSSKHHLIKTPLHQTLLHQTTPSSNHPFIKPPLHQTPLHQNTTSSKHHFFKHHFSRRLVS